MAQRRNCPEHAKRGRKTPESLAVTYFNAPVASFTGLLTVHSRAEFSVTLMSLAALRNFELINHLIKLFIDVPHLRSNRTIATQKYPVLMSFSRTKLITVSYFSYFFFCSAEKLYIAGRTRKIRTENTSGTRP